MIHFRDGVFFQRLIAKENGIQGGDMKLSVNFKPTQLLNQFEFYRQKLPKHAPECFE